MIVLQRPTPVADASKVTVSKLLIDAGRACAKFHDENVIGVRAARVQYDEIWRFTYAKQKNVAGAKAAPEGAGDTWTWTALDSDAKLVISCMVGARDSAAKNPRLARMLERKPPMIAAFALANKMARGIWAMMTRGEDYRGPEIGSAA